MGLYFLNFSMLMNHLGIDQSVFRVQLSSVVVLSLGFQSEAFTQYQSLGPTPSD